MKLSVCMITKNEERCIERCLKSCITAVDEVILVDTGSTDNTVNIAKKLGAKILHFKWQNDFALARNFALRHAGGDWVLSLDADEYFEKGAATKLRAYVEKTIKRHPDVDCISVRQYQLDASGNTDEFVGKEILFRNNAGIQFEGVIHEHLMKKGGNLKVIAAPPNEVSFMHDGYIGALNREKSLRNIELLKGQLEKNSEDAMLYNYMAQSNFPLRDYEAVLHYSLEFLKRAQNPSPHVLRALLWCEEALRMLPLALDEARTKRKFISGEALRLFPKHPTAYLIAGNTEYELGETKSALAYYEKAATLREANAQSEEDEVFSINLQNSAWAGVYTRLGLLFLQNGDNSSALKFYTAALSENPDTTAAITGYMQCNSETGAKPLAANLLELQAKAANKKAYVQAARACRCDLCFLILYDAWLKQNPLRDALFTTMQVLVGQTQAAVLDTVGKLTHHPLWCGNFEQTALYLEPSEELALEDTIAEAFCGALILGDVQLLRTLAPVCPAALAAAIQLCIGDELEGFPGGERDILRICEKRLAALGASEDIKTLWSEILRLTGV